MSPEKKTILVVEDNKNDVYFIQEALAAENFPCVVKRVSDGVDALAYLKGENHFGDRKNNPLPALVLCDIKMPRMNGFEVLEWVRAQKEFEKIPVVMLTSSNEKSDQDRAEKLGSTCFFKKDVLFESPQQFVHVIQRCLNFAA